MAVIRAYSMCASGVEKCAQTLLRTVLRAYLATTSVVSCGHAGVGVDVGKYDGPMI